MMNQFTEEAGGRGSVQIPILDREVTAEVTGDYSLPDYLPEIKRLLRIRPSLLPPNRFAGRDSVGLSGALDYYVMYMGQDGGVYCAPLAAEYRLDAESDGGDRSLSAMAEEPFLCLCDATADPPVGRVTAPRRLNIRCKINARVKLYGEFPTDPASEDPTTEKLTEAKEVSRLFWSMGEPVPLQDDIILSPAEGEWRVICAEGEAMVSEATPTEGTVHCRGDVTLKLTLCPAEDAEAFASDTPSRRGAVPLTTLYRKIPFSTAVEIPGVTSACSAAAWGYCTDISVQMEEGNIHAELSLVPEVRAQRNETVRYTRDLYSTKRTCSCAYTTSPTEVALRAQCGNFTMSDSIPLTDTELLPTDVITDVTMEAVPLELSTDPEKGRMKLTGICRCHLLLLRDGEYASVGQEFPFRYEMDGRPLTGNTELPANAPAYDGHVTILNCRARMDGERLGVDAELAVSLRIHTPAPMTAVSEVAFGEEVTRRRGEYVICFPTPADSVWSVAKRYHAPVAALTAANNLPGGMHPGSEESLEGVGYLIV